VASSAIWQTIAARLDVGAWRPWDHGSFDEIVTSHDAARLHF
jgi:hypothetical protein